MNGQNEETYSPINYKNELITTSLTITDTTSNFNYGFSFVRELKLFNSYNFDFWDESHYNIKKEHLIELIDDLESTLDDMSEYYEEKNR